MTDKPTDAELIAVWRIEAGKSWNSSNDIRTGYARAVLAKWGRPAQAVEPVAYRYKFKEDLQWQYTINKAQAHQLAVVEPLFTAPQPVAREPLTNEECTQIYHEANNITTKNPPITTERIFNAMRAAHGIKGGQHGTE